MNSTARTVSATLCENDPSPQSPSESPRPRLSKRSIPTPSLASCLQMRLAAGLSLPRVNPWAKTPQPRTSPSGRSTRPARVGPVVLGKLTRSATCAILSLAGRHRIRMRRAGRTDENGPRSVLRGPFYLVAGTGFEPATSGL